MMNQETVRPCCIWQFDQTYKQTHQLDRVNLVTWHNNADVQKAKDLLKNNVWPKNCSFCEQSETQGRSDSMRLNAASSYANYNQDDITLEIRPGSVCNFACQTCWPAASSRVAQYHHRAGMIDIRNVNSQSMDNFDFLLPVASQIRSAIVLGGEPFYDPSCQKFLHWAQQHLTATITVFTNQQF